MSFWCAAKIPSLVHLIPRPSKASAAEDGYVCLWSLTLQKQVNQQPLMAEARSGADPCVVVKDG